ncbi:hypothetical protein ACHAQH_006794 [Verticillium albo-atrum]
MAEFALAASILSTIGFAIQLWTDSSEVRKSGMSISTADCRRQADSLRAHCDRVRLLQDSETELDEAVRMQSRCLDNHIMLMMAKARIRDIATEIHEFGEELSTRLAKSTLKPGVEGWRRYHDVIVVLWRGMRMDADAQMRRLGALRNELQSELLVSMLRKVSFVDLQNKEGFRKLDDDLKALTLTVLQGLAAVVTKVDSLAVAGEQRHLEVMAELRKWDPMATPIRSAATETIDLAWKKEKIKDLKNRLWYGAMPRRHDAITTAHEKTFEWIFTGQKKTPESNMTMMEWMVAGTGPYWVSGRAGTGKSSLMRFLNDDARTREAFQAWAGERPLGMASFYFWNSDAAGDNRLKSLAGLYRAILFELIEQHPILVETFFPGHMVRGRRWDDDFPTFLDMAQAFDKLSNARTLPVAVGLIIDGLDEYEAPSSKQIEAAEMLRRASESPNIKVIVSSRPEAAFEMAFRGSTKLRLHELTEEDRRTFVSDKIKAVPRLLTITTEEQQSELIKLVVERSEGIFLWVHLAVGTQIEEIGWAMDVSRLLKVVTDIPGGNRELDVIFDHMLRRRIPERHRALGLRLIQTLKYGTAWQTALHVARQSSTTTFEERREIGEVLLALLGAGADIQALVEWTQERRIGTRRWVSDHFSRTAAEQIRLTFVHGDVMDPGRYSESLKGGGFSDEEVRALVELGKKLLKALAEKRTWNMALRHKVDDTRTRVYHQLHRWGKVLLRKLQALQVQSDRKESQIATDASSQPPATTQEESKVTVTVAATAPLELIFCRFESGQIVRKKRLLSEPFIAISHVWGPDADWAKVDGVEDEIIVSPEKAIFMQTQLPALLGDSWFWMDVLCVDQRDADARVAVTQHIPAVFRAAQKSLVIRESASFRDCCAKAAGPSHAFLGKTRFGRRPDDQSSDIDFTDDEMDGRGKLRQHIEQSHVGEYMDDGVLSRLWPLQEVILSDTVQFARCEPVPGSDPKGISPSRPRPSMDKALTLVGSLGTLAQAWDTYCLDDDSDMWHRLGTGKWSFFSAYFGLGEATRSNSGKVSPKVPRARDLGMHLISTRQTSKGRDFILATMPQYQFYRVPKTARKMTFSELFIDCCHQLRDHDVGIAPFLMDSDSPLDGAVGTLSCGVPEPICLGDLAKLFNGPVQRSPERSVVELLSLQPQPAPTSVAKRQALELLKHAPDPTSDGAPMAMAVSMTHLIVISIFASKVSWLTSQAELMHEIARLQEKEDREDSDSEDDNGGVSETMQRRLVLEALLRTVSWIDWSEGSRTNAEAMTGKAAVLYRLKDAPWEMSAMLVAMVSCGMPLSAYDWAKEHLAVLHVSVFQRSFMALAPKKVVKPGTMFFMRQVDDYAMGRDGAMSRFTLLAMDASSETYMNQCMFPPDLALSNG